MTKRPRRRREPCAARLSAPTAVASNAPAPSTTNEPDSTWSPASRNTGSDSPVTFDSSNARPSPRTRCRRPPPDRRLPTRTRSPTTTSSIGTSRGRPSRITVARRRHQRGELVQRALGAHLLERPDRDVRDQDAQEQRVLGIAERDRRRPERRQDHVEDRERVRDAIDRYERLDESFGRGPRSRNRRCASAWVKPAPDPAACTVPLTRHQAR